MVDELKATLDDKEFENQSKYIQELEFQIRTRDVEINALKQLIIKLAAHMEGIEL